MSDEAREVVGEAVGRRSVQRRPLAAVEPRRVRWLVPGLIPLKALTLVAGVGGLGKSTLLMAIAAQATRGELATEPADVLVVSYEDTAAEVLRPRVEAARGDLARVHELYVPPADGAPLTLPTDLGELERHVRETGAVLVVVDPVVASIDLELDAHKDQHVRSVLAELAALAEDAGCAVALVGHLNKTPSRDAYIRVANSTAFYNAARSVVLVTVDPAEPEAQRLVTQAKANWARLRPVQRHVVEEIRLERLDRESGEPIVTSRMRYLEDAEDVDRDDVLAERRGRPAGEKFETALEFLTGTLADGDWHDSAGLKVLAAAQGVSEPTLKRAALDLGVEHERRGFPAVTYWRLRSRVTGSPETLSRLARPHGYAESGAVGSLAHGGIEADPTAAGDVGRIMAELGGRDRFCDACATPGRCDTDGCLDIARRTAAYAAANANERRRGDGTTDPDGRAGREGGP